MSEKSASLGRRIGLAASGFLFIALTVLAIDTTIDIWPAIGVHSDLCKRAETIPEDQRAEFLETIKRAGKVNCKFGDIPVTRVNLGGTHTFLAADQALIALTALTAVIGGLLRSLVGIGEAARSGPNGTFSFAWCLMRPFIALALGMVVLLALRAFFLPSGKLMTVNPYGFMTVAAVVGLFTDQIVRWLWDTGRTMARR